MAAQVQNTGLANLTAAWVAYTSRGKYMQWGVGSGQAVTATTIANAGTTTEARTDGTTTQQTTTTTNDTYRIVGTITALETLAVTELGIFDSAGSGTPPTGGNMCFYADFSAINLNTSDSINFTFNVVADQA